MASMYLILVKHFTGKPVRYNFKKSNKADYEFFSFTKEQRRKGRRKIPSIFKRKILTTTRCHCILASCKNGLLRGMLQHLPPCHKGILGTNSKSWLMLGPFHVVDTWEVDG